MRKLAAMLALLACGCADTRVAPSNVARQLSPGCEGVPSDEAKLVGTWRIAADPALAPVLVAEDGTTRAFYRNDPGGRLIFDSGGNFILNVIEGGIPPFATPSREQGTDAENRAVVHGSITNYGRYWVQRCGNRRQLVLRIERSTFPNWNGITQARDLVDVNSRQLRYEVPESSSGGRARFVWDRMD